MTNRARPFHSFLMVAFVWTGTVPAEARAPEKLFTRHTCVQQVLLKCPGLRLAGQLAAGRCKTPDGWLLLLLTPIDRGRVRVSNVMAGGQAGFLDNYLMPR